MTRSVPVILVALVLLMAVPCFASESFTLDIPIRGNPQQETGEVRITLTLNAAPAGAQLVVNGATTLNLGDTKTVSGDSVSFLNGGGNDVRIIYKVLSNFAADFCQGNFAVPKSIPMRFSGAQDVTAYRMSSYIVASPTVECSQPSKHTGDTPATLTAVDDGVAPALVAQSLGRNQFDVTLVLDKSGSMSELPPGAAAGATKAQILKSAVTAFVSTWRQLDQQEPTGEEWPKDRIGLEFFNQGPLPQTFPSGDPPANFFVQRGLAIPGNWDDIINGVNTLSPGGSTSIGGGINDAMAKWSADPQNDLSVILVTDGKQNTSPLIQPTGSGFLGLTPVAGLPQELRKRFIPIHTVAFGQPAGVDLDLLTNVSFETSGASFLTVNDQAMYDTFASLLVAILKGNTAGLALQQNATMTGTGPTPLSPLLVDASAKRAVFLLQWGPEHRFALDMDVYRPGVDPSAGGLPAVQKSGEKQPQATIKTFDMVNSRDRTDVGTWHVRVKRDKSEPNEQIPYTLNVLFVEKHLDYRVAFDHVHTATGDNIGIQAVVAWDGKPLAGLPAGAIRVRIQRPPEGIGTILAKSPRDPGTGNTVTPSGDILTPYDRKVAMISDAKLLTRLLPRDVDSIALTDQGNGVYGGSFAGTSVPGSYGFEVVLDWDDVRTGHLHRQERMEQTVKVLPDFASSTIKVTRDANNNVLIAVTPRDKFGNYMGPGYASLVNATLRSTGRITPVPADANQTGTYVFTVFGVPAGQTPLVDITVDGVPFTRSPRETGGVKPKS